MEETVMFIPQSEAVKLGKDHWEREYAKLRANRDVYIRKIITDMKGMTGKDVLEGFAALQVDGFFRAFRSWIDQTFKDSL